MPTEPLGAPEAPLAGRYEFVRELGRGAWGVVYLATDRANARRVAVKLMRLELGATRAEERFAREISIVTQLSHPNIVPVLDAGAVGGTRYFVMPFLDGESLSQRLSREKQLPLEDAIQIAREVASALAYAHKADVVHRDIKPANILLADGHAQIADFGIARAISRAAPVEWQSSNRTQVGTAQYMSPEQAAGDENVDGRSDIYSLGCVLYEMLGGTPPFSGATASAVLARHAFDSVPPLRTVRAGIPPGLDAIVSRALAKAPADRYQSAAELVLALDHAWRSNSTRTPISASARRLWRSRWSGATLLLLLLGASVAAFEWTRRGGSATRNGEYDRHLLAVAPFSVLDADFSLWREGFVDILSRNLDAAGPMRTASVAVVLREWRNASSDASVAELCRRTGARYAVQGALVRSGKDSVRVSTALYDATLARVIAEAEVKEPADHVDRAADRLTVAVLRQLGATGEAAIAEARLAGAATSPPLAIKAFLNGEHFFRQTAWDSAIAYYRQSVELEPRQPLALFRLSLATRWQSLNGDSLSSAYALQADSLNHGLAPRESLLVRAGALFSKLTQGFADPEYWPHRAELFSVLEAATRRYPDAAEAWYATGEARYRGDASARAALDAYDRAIRIDSGFAPAYPNAVIMAMALRGTASARAYLNAYLRLNPTDVNADGYSLAAQLLERGARAPGIRPVLDTASADVLESASQVLAYWPDSAESAVFLTRSFAAGRPTRAQAFADSTFTSFQIAHVLAFRGHLREAIDALGTAPSRLARVPGSQYLRATIVASLMMLGAKPDGDARQFFEAIAQAPIDRPTGIILALPWWADRGDTAALRRVAQRAHAAIDARSKGVQAPYARYVDVAARGYLALARRDSAGALAQLMSLPEPGCMYPYCPFDRLVAARLLEARGDIAGAERILDDVPNFYGPLAVLWRYYRAEVAERRGHRDTALQEYGYVTDAWVHADAVLQPIVASARAGLRRLTSSR